jgi:hypothetical protein
LQLDAPPVLRIDGFVDEATLEKLVSDRGDKSPAEVKVIGDAALGCPKRLLTADVASRWSFVATPPVTWTGSQFLL